MTSRARLLARIMFRSRTYCQLREEDPDDVQSLFDLNLIHWQLLRDEWRVYVVALAPFGHTAYNGTVSPRDFVAPIGISGVRL